MTEFRNILVNIITSLYQTFGASVVFAILFMLGYWKRKEVGIANTIRNWISEFRSNAEFRSWFYLAAYTGMILFRTLLCRKLWVNPVENVIGVWGLHNNDGSLSTEIIENCILFIPWTYLMFSMKGCTISSLGEGVSLLWNALRFSFSFSLAIELLQIFLKLGTFQLSDLFFNSLGGLVGGGLYVFKKQLNNFNRTSIGDKYGKEKTKLH